jgi:hypothetical protein
MYKLVWAKVPRELEAAVNDLIRSGWIPKGGVFAFNTPVGLMWYQAMTKGI